MNSKIFRLCKRGLIKIWENNAIKKGITSETSKVKIKYFHNVFGKFKNNLRNTWLNIKDVLDVSGNKETIRKILCIDVETNDVFQSSPIF